MGLWTYQTDDSFASDGSVFRIYHFAVWRWWRIWGKTIKPASYPSRQAHSEGAEIAYMRAHPEIWPETDDYSAVYAEHHMATETTSSWDVQFGRKAKSGEADNGSAGS